MTFEEVGRFLLQLPDVTASTSYGTPSFRAGKKFLVRLREPDILVVPISLDEREMLMEAEPETFFITDHYRGYPLVLLRLSRVHAGTLERLLTQGWRQIASKRALAAHDADKAESPP